VGCGDAVHTIKYARKVKYIWGLDVAESLVKVAEERARSEEVWNIEFTVGSITEAVRIFGGKPVDCVISQRCIINLPSWSEQSEAISQLHQLLKPGGSLLMTEGFQEELDTLNTIRVQLNLPPIQVVDYNRNLRHKEFDEFIERYFAVEDVIDYGLYILLSRVYHPLVVYPDPPAHASRLNEAAATLARILSMSSFRQISYNLLYVLRKR
jgi:SAM-dependent methyltransferase